MQKVATNQAYTLHLQPKTCTGSNSGILVQVRNEHRAGSDTHESNYT